LATLTSPAVVAGPPVQEEICQEVYVVQADDWLSQIAAKFLGNADAYPALAAATNELHASDRTFARIADPDLLEVGWKLCVPVTEVAQAFLNDAVASPAEAGNLTVFAAASLTEAFTEIGRQFEATYPGVTVIYNFAGSQQLAQQLGQGAPADVFASANSKQMEVALETGRVAEDTPQLFAHNRLVVVYPTDNPAQITDLPDLARPGVVLILAAGEVPVGRYSLEFLDKAGQAPPLGTEYKEAVLSNVVSYEQTVKAVFTKVALGEGDAGIVYSSDISQDNAGKVGRLDIPDSLNTVADYPIAPVADAANPELARTFIDFVRGTEGQAILASYNFIPVEPSGGRVVVTDALGRTLEFAQPPQRIVVAGKAIFMVADALYLFPEAIDRVVTLPSGGQNVGEFLSLVDPAFNDKTFLEPEAGPEQIAAVHPDLVVLKSFMAGRLGAPLEQLGIPVVYVDLETPEQYRHDISTLGQLLANPARAGQILSFYEQRLEQVEQAVRGLSQAAKPRVLLLQYSRRGDEVAFNVPPADWIQTIMVDLAGGTPVWTEASSSGGWTVVNFEQIAAWDPDQIFIVNYFGDVTEVVERLKADPQWQALPAVEKGQLYAFPKDFYSWDQPDARWILGLQWLATRIQPEWFQEIDMSREVERFYAELYGLDQSIIQEKIHPKLDDDLP
jgi:iron complex transport system substrate-binding protein